MSCIVFVHRISFANFFGCVLSLVQGHRAGASQVADKQDLRGQTVYFFSAGITHFHHHSNAIVWLNMSVSSTWTSEIY